jgi:polyhydroxyalkanoate synthase subunit PhaC
MPSNSPFDPLQLLHSASEQHRLNQLFDPFGITRSYLEVQQAWLSHPEQLFDWTLKLYQEVWAVQLQSWERFSGMAVGDRVEPIEYDERFQEAVWTQQPYLDNLKEFYLLTTRWTQDAIFATPDASPQSVQKTAFWVRQLLNAVAPTNFFWMNPIAMQRMMETGGQSVFKGLQHFVTDSKLNTIRMVDNTAFTVGKDLANTPGAVIYRCPLFELLQYSPKTEQVNEIPLLFIPPWINKYYILDLGEKKSLVNFLVKQGHTVFLISWKNPTAEMRQVTLDDYLAAALEAIHVVQAVAQVSQVHAIGYCIGGIILTALMAWLSAEAQHPIASWSLFTTLVDFSQPGEIGVFIDDDTVRYLENLMQKTGYLDGKAMANSFRMIRANSLIWHYFVHNYLYGEDLPAFDVLFWNNDSTRLPAAMHTFYLREFYLNNKLMQPNAISLRGRSIDIRRIQQPLYAVGTEQDHIAPWQETFKICHLIQSPTRYVLATSGHIMGIISPPVEPPKRRYWVGEATGAQDGEKWRETIPKVPGSWWLDWDNWLNQHGSMLQAPPSLGNTEYPILGDAPGNYVLEK